MSEVWVSNKGLRWALVVLGISLFGGCATGGSFQEGEGGDGGSAGEGAGGKGGAGGAGQASGSSTASSSASGSGGGASSSSSSVSSSAAGGIPCGAQQHACAGACTGNTPESGCFQSTTCAACASSPNGKAICTAQGACDLSCNSGYTKSGNACVCQYACCSDADCPAGQACSGGTCSGGGSSSSGGGTCTDDAFFQCTFLCTFQQKTCNPATCMCQ
jgi:hypothetical protein